MSSINITIPESIRNRVEDFAREEGVSVEDFVALVLSQRIAVADADSYVRKRAERGSSEHLLLEILGRAPDVDVEPGDRINNGSQRGVEPNAESAGG